MFHSARTYSTLQTLTPAVPVRAAARDPDKKSDANVPEDLINQLCLDLHNERTQVLSQTGKGKK